MRHKGLKKYLSVSCLLAVGLAASQALYAQPQYNRGYGDFPPASIDQQLQGNPNTGSQPAARQPRSYRGSNPWSNNYQPAPYPAQNYPPQNYPPQNFPPRNYSPQNYPPQNYPTQGYPPANYGAYPYGGGPGFSGPWNNRGSNFSPWGNRGGRNPFGNRDPGDWFDPNKGSMSRNWDDMLNAPSRMGEMPGGWTAPSVSVPNPIDVGEEFSDAAKDAPDQMDNFNWNNNRRNYR